MILWFWDPKNPSGDCRFFIILQKLRFLIFICDLLGNSEETMVARRVFEGPETIKLLLKSEIRPSKNPSGDQCFCNIPKKITNGNENATFFKIMKKRWSPEGVFRVPKP